jgi:hypothetical protein
VRAKAVWILKHEHNHRTHTRMTIHQLLMFAARLASASARFRFKFRPLALRLGARLALPLLLLTLPASAQAQYGWVTNEDGTLTITGYSGPGSAITIPGTIDGQAVSAIGNRAFYGIGLTSLTIPSSVTNIAPSYLRADVLFGSFAGCASLTNISVHPLNPAYTSRDGVLFSRPAFSASLWLELPISHSSWMPPRTSPPAPGRRSKAARLPTARSHSLTQTGRIIPPAFIESAPRDDRPVEKRSKKPNETHL